MNILNLQQAARLLQMNPESLRRLAFRGAIPARKPGRKWLFVEEHLKEWLKGDYAASGEMAHKRGELCPSKTRRQSQLLGQHLNPGLQAGAEKRSDCKPEISTGVP